MTTQIDHTGDARVQAFLAARNRIEDTLNYDRTIRKIVVNRDDLQSLLSGQAPDADLPSSWAEFDARFVPFLRCVDRDTWAVKSNGITVMPHPEGGCTLFSTDGRIALIAHDRRARVSDGGCRVLMPESAMDACNPPKPTEFDDEGEVCTAELPEWMLPDMVYCLGASLLVAPKAQPETTGGGDGLALWHGMITTSRSWRDTDSRRLPPFKWTGLLRKLEKLPTKPTAGVSMGAPVMGQMAKAMAAIPGTWVWQIALLWDGDPGGSPIVARPHEGPAGSYGDITIIAMPCMGEQGQPFPKWLVADYSDTMVNAARDMPNGTISVG